MKVQFDRYKREFSESMKKIKRLTCKALTYSRISVLKRKSVSIYILINYSITNNISSSVIGKVSSQLLNS